VTRDRDLEEAKQRTHTLPAVASRRTVQTNNPARRIILERMATMKNLIRERFATSRR
jgi:hypothetical protein